mmetsp:Transcript_15938/g.20172  ORF Transcript_15938/g.20172 Transcript_15938/m.20172 type:complete len:509 (-) Transcript_15938:81-1607(-)
MSPSSEILHNNNDDNSTTSTTTPGYVSFTSLKENKLKSLRSNTTSSTALESAFLSNDDDDSPPSSNTTKLILTFTSFVLSGTILAVLSKLQALTMYNYPNFLNVWSCVLYVPLCFLYILPAAKYKLIPPEQLEHSKTPFLFMAIFDTLASTMTTFASVYLPGPLLVLLPQASIPMSMLLSKFYLKSKYGKWQYAGAAVVILGILVVLEPVMTNRHAPDYVCVALDEERDCVDCISQMSQEECEGFASSSDEGNLTDIFNDVVVGDVSIATCEWVESTHETSGTSTLLFWAFILVLSCLPASMSSIYKEQKLGEVEWDPVYLNGWIALIQVPMSLVLALPGGLVTSPPVPPSDLPGNFYDGFKCFTGTESITEGCHPDDCRYALLAMSLFIIVCFIFTNLMILLLKYSSANLMFLALTCIVPLGNLAFALPFMPGRVAMNSSDLIGLSVIMFGIVSYRFGSVLFGGGDTTEEEEHEKNDLLQPLLNLEELGLEVEVVSEDGRLSRRHLI